jgi:CheY-like chemotaxis protein
MSIAQIQVLVVDDDDVSAQVARAMLEKLGCRVALASNGAEAIVLFRKETFDLILMGWKMLLMDGFEATARIRTMPQGRVTPIIGTSAGVARSECLAAGMNDLMPKPFLLDTLKMTLSKWTHWEENV